MTHSSASVADVRPERPEDIAAIHAVHASAFETDFEARLVDALREHARPIVSLVGVTADEVAGHILLSPVTHDSAADVRLMGLAPVAVTPAWQRRGIGAALVRAGIEACRQLDAAGIVLVGHPEYYPRFGFVPASRFGLRSEYDLPDEVFMAMELREGALRVVPAGTVRYHPLFGMT